MTERMEKRFAALKTEGRPALITYFMGGDPDFDTSLQIMKALPKAGADVIELGMPFSDPMADGPAIQAAGLRALKSGQTLARTLRISAEFRKDDDETPIVHLVRDGRDVIVSGAAHRLNIARQRWAGGMQGAGSEDLEAERGMLRRRAENRAAFSPCAGLPRTPRP